MKSILAFVILALVFLSCSNQKGRPDDVLNRDQMVAILLDIHLAEARVSQAKMPVDSSLNYYAYLEQQIFQKHNTDSAEYKRSMDYYTLNIRELDAIYETVLDSLNIRSAEESRTVTK